MNDMKLFLDYLRSRRRVFAVAGVCCAVFALSFWLYALPLSAVLYPAGLCAIICLAALMTDYRRVKRRHDELVLLREQPIAIADTFPEAASVEEADYQALLTLLREEAQRTTRLAQEKYAETVEYYTIWAHQIKTPIASMRLQLQNEDSALSRQLLTELGRIEQYADMVLTYLRLDSPSSDYVIRECDLDAIVRPAVRKFAGEFIARKLRLDYTSLNVRVLTDEKWLGFVVEQLLSNALKYTPEGTISVFLAEPATLCIRDTGIGIAPEDSPRIFERGYTGYNGRTDRRASGIGLYLCARIIRNLHHTIRVESEVGKGTTVFLDLAREPHRVE